jgi:hypothetical protein
MKSRGKKKATKKASKKAQNGFSEAPQVHVIPHISFFYFWSVL